MKKKASFTYRYNTARVPYKNLIILGLYILAVLIGTIFIFKKAYERAYDPVSGFRWGDSVDYIEISSKQRESRELFKLIDQNEDGALTQEEMESYVLYRFKSYDKSLKDPPILDQNGKITFETHEIVLSKTFLAELDANKDGKLTDEDLTVDNVETLFNKAKLILNTLDLDSNGSVDWDEFFNCV